MTLFDLSAKPFLRLAGDALPARYRGWLGRYRLGPGVFKLDYALDGPVPWKDPACRRAATLHLGGTLAEIAHSEREVAAGRAPTKPYVLVAQHGPFDDTRAPVGKETFWAYCHVPNGFTGDLTEAVEGQLERFAPGFCERVLARHATGPAALERGNPNYVGGDINGGAASFWQLVARPVPTGNPYCTPLKGVYLCSASTPPGGGVHGMAGYWAAQAALRGHFPEIGCR